MSDDLRLEIRLLSPLCSGTGVGQPGMVDREASFSPDGLPFLGGRRLKGLWRDAYEELFSTAIGERLPAAEKLFGSAFGQRSRPGTLSVSDAALAGAGSVSAWIRDSELGRPEILACFSEIRRQTAIDHILGRAQQDTLRSTRVLRQTLPDGAPLTFYAPVAATLDRQEQLALAAAALALRSIGTSRNRGWGEVKCSLLLGSRDLSEEALRWLDSGQTDAESPGKASLDALPPLDLVPGEKLSAASFQLTLEADALFPRLGGDPFTVASHDWIPGQALRGALAKLYLARLPQPEPDERFFELFCRETMRFLPAYPAIVGASVTGSVPSPASLREYKDAGLPRFTDLAWEQADPDRALARTGGFIRLRQYYERGKAVKVGPLRKLHYHHTRASDRRVQRALGQDYDKETFPGVEQPGAFFNYEPLAAGQVFQGEFRGPASCLAWLRQFIADGQRLELGRSRSAQYGGQAVWKWVDAPGNASLGTVSPSSRLQVILLSPLLGWNRDGHPAAEFPWEDLGLPIEQIENEFVRTGWEGGFLSHLKLPRAQARCLEAGSVFVLKLSEAADPGTILRLESRGYGMRCEDGFGQVSICALPDSDESQREPWFESFGFERGTCQARPSAPPVPMAGLADALWRDRIRRKATAEAFELAGRIQILPEESHALTRVSRILDHDSHLEDFAGRFQGGFREPIMKELRRIRLTLDPKEWKDAPQTLERFLPWTAEHWQNRADWLTGLTRGVPSADAPRDPEFQRETVKTFLANFLRAIVLRKRGKA